MHYIYSPENFAYYMVKLCKYVILVFQNGTLKLKAFIPP